MRATRALPGTGRRDAPVVTGLERAGGRAQDSAGIRETFPYMAHSGAPHPATRSATCHRPRVRSQPRGGRGVVPRQVAGWGRRCALRALAAAPTSIPPWTPWKFPGPPPPLTRPHTGAYLGKFPAPQPAPGGFPCDPNWPLRPVITAPVWFFFLVGGSSGFTETTYSPCAPFFLRSRKLPRPGGGRSP